MNKRVFRFLILNLIVWIGIIIAYYLYLEAFIPFWNFTHQAFIISLMVITYYVCHLIIIPLLLFKRKYFLFVLSLLLLFSVAVFAKYEIQKKFIKPLEQISQGLTPSEKAKLNQILSQEKFKNLPQNIPSVQNGDTFTDLLKSPRFIMNNILSILLVILTSISIKLAYRWNLNEEAKLNYKKEKIEAELSMLKRQMNPHFLFNSLNSIYALSINKSELVTKSLLKLSSILRYFLYEEIHSDVKLTDELKVINDYIDLQRLRISENVTLSYNIVGSPGDYKIEPFIIMPLIENTFKHGIDNVQESFIDIAIIIMHEKIGIKLMNRIVNKSYTKNYNSGIGINNIKRRLDLIYPGKYKLDINRTEDIFTTHLELKLTK